MKKLYWLWFGLILWVCRALLLCSVYFMDTPAGGPIVDRWYRFFPHSLVAEAGVTMWLAFICGALATLCGATFIAKAWRDRLQKGVGIASIVLGGLYILASAMDGEIMRWMGQHLSVSFLVTYSGAASEMGLVSRVFLGGAGHFLLTLLLGVGGLVAIIALYRRCFGAWRENCGTGLSRSVAFWISSAVILALGITGYTSNKWFAPSKMRWKRITPVVYHLANEISYKFSAAEKRSDFAEGILTLGGDPESEYPFWHKVPEDEANLENFRNRPMDEKPDIVLLTIETFRGWTGDVRVPATCEKLPNLCKLAGSGAYFPNAHSVGYPSIEGFLGMLAGVWSHPRFTFLSDVPNTQMRALPDVLKDAGYYRMVLTATEPSFDNLNPWFERWFDYSEYDPKNQHDVPIADRFRELYRNRPADKPLFFDWMSTSSHVPFTIPDEYGPTPKDPEVAYIRSLAYMDSAVGIVLDEIAKGPRANSTLIVLSGDHAIATNAQHGVHEFIGGTHDGYTWVPLVFAGAGVETFVDSSVVSHVDIAPTVLASIGLNVSNNFVGTDLQVSSTERRACKPVFSFRMDDIAMEEDTLTYYASMIDSTAGSVFGTRFMPDWDVVHPVEGFVTGHTVPEKPDAAVLHRMRAAAFAWEYVVNQNLLMPAP